MNIKALVLTLLIAGAAVFGLFYCSRNKANTSVKTSNPTKETKSKKKRKNYNILPQIEQMERTIFGT
jgi:hypothetical protein